MFKTEFEEEIEAYYRDVYRKLIDKDFEALDDIFDDGFEIEHVWGDVHSKDEFLEALSSEYLVLYSENLERVYIEKGDDEIKVRGRSLVNTSRDGSRRRIRRVQVDFTMKKLPADAEGDGAVAEVGEDRWRVLDAKVSLY